ncbi:SLBB domain-containing protein [Pseudoalteromonas sp. KG3]|uniref:SLBB domain-containing protein n=1 Tax=Pseudoalteromonas sp. KG3 TaxID=2951137 RepID=UPI00265A7F10|nr:SLBB domain-containing protein [Pseudoalteromonas sp. KG3]WKD25304.1 SLBB domain-containing protein [Pseudoalteromonas sp. KG3]
MFVKLFRIFASLLLLSLALPSFSQANGVTPTKQQIEQFKKLPKSQQTIIANKYGIDMSILEKQGTESTQNTENLDSVMPREKAEKEELTGEEKFKPKQDEPEPFGYELFSGEPTSFTPSENALVPDSYIIGPGDTLTINLYGKESSTEEVTVDREGRIALQKLSPVTVTGMQYAEVVKLIKAKVKQEVIGTEAFVSMGKARSIRIMVLGESYKPGTYTVPALASITHALFVSGGISEIGSLRNIQLKRAGKTIETLDIYDLLIKGDSSSDVILKPGDVVFIPPVGKQVTIDGQVRRPAIYELKNNETVGELIKMAGGFKASAFPEKTIVERYTANSFKTILQFDLTGDNNNQVLKNGDSVKVPESSKELNNAVTLLGAVTYPGSYSWQKGDTISRLIGAPKSDLLPIADFDYGLIIREVNSKRDIEVYQFSPLQASQMNKYHDLELQPRDTIVIFSRYQEKANEENALNSMALTEEQLKLRERLKLWGEYEDKQFYEFVDLGSALDKELAENLAEETKKASSISELLKSDSKQLKDEEYAVFSREKLLQPILAKLNQQATYNQQVKVFGVRGEVRFEGIYPLPVNGTVSKAVAAAGGLKESAYLANAEITRFTSNTETSLEHVSISLSEALNNDMQDKFSINSKDALNIYPIPNWQKDQSIRILGEVRFPGTYTIKKGEQLADVLKRAGGFTNYAFPAGAVFTREAIRIQEQQQLDKLSEDLRRDIASKSFNNSITDASLSYSDMDNLLKDLADVDAVGRLVLDLPAVEKGQITIELQDKDALYIPSKRSNVSVIGEVSFATSHLYDPSLSLDDYIRRSGGLKQRADGERIYIIKASGLVEIPDESSWFAVNDNIQLEAGDTIVVPLDSEYVDNLTLWSTATQILYQMGIAVAAISSL